MALLNICISIFYSLLSLLVVLFWPGLAAIAIYYSLPVSLQIFLLTLCILYGIGPLIIAAIASYLAERYHCHSQGLSYTCPHNPQMGGVISTMMFIGAWGPVLTIPSAVFGSIGFIISLVFAKF